METQRNSDVRATERVFKKVVYPGLETLRVVDRNGIPLTYPAYNSVHSKSFVLSPRGVPMRKSNHVYSGSHSHPAKLTDLVDNTSSPDNYYGPEKTFLTQGSYSAKLPRNRNESPLQQKQRAITSQSMAPKHTSKSISSDHYLTGEPNERRILQAANNNYFNLSNQGLRLQREWTSLSNTRSMRRASEIVNHRVDRMYFMNGNSIKLKPKYDVDEEELNRMKEEAHKRINSIEDTFKSHTTMQPKGDNPDSNCILEETFSSHKLEDICDRSHVDYESYVTEDDEIKHEEERPKSQCRINENEEERPKSQCRIDENKEERPKSQSIVDELEEERPQSQCRVEENEEENPISQCIIEENEEERPESQCRVDENEEEIHISQCKIDENEEERPKSQCQICDHVVEVRLTVSIETGIPDTDFKAGEINYGVDDIEIDHDHCVDGSLDVVDILSHEDQHAIGKCMIELMTNYSNDKRETKFQKKKPKFVSSGLKKSRKRPKKTSQKFQINYDAFNAKYPHVKSFPLTKQAKTKPIQKPVDCVCRKFGEPPCPCLTITGQQVPAYNYSVWMKDASVTEDGGSRTSSRNSMKSGPKKKDPIDLKKTIGTESEGGTGDVTTSSEVNLKKPNGRLSPINGWEGKEKVVEEENDLLRQNTLHEGNDAEKTEEVVENGDTSENKEEESDGLQGMRADGRIDSSALNNDTEKEEEVKENDVTVNGKEEITPDTDEQQGETMDENIAQENT